MHFRRTYLSQQVADRLAAEWRNGVWQGHLPGERRLADFLGVSRRTVRAALALLARSGTLRSHKGRRMFVASSKNRPVRSGRKTAVLIGSNLSNRMSGSSRMIQVLAHCFALAGYTLQIEVIPGRVNLPRRLELICKKQQASIWLLCSVGRDVQRWFDRRKLPALILGSRHEGIHLPDIDVDYRAVCRHAAHALWRLGHRRIVFLNVDSGFAGDLASEKGVHEALAASASGAATARIVRHKGNAAQIGRLLNRMFNGTEAPTALIVSQACYAMTVLGHLLQMGKRIPADVSVICRDDDPLFEFFVPPPARYSLDLNQLVRRTVQLAVRIDQGEAPPVVSLHLMPQFIRGGSIGPPAG